MGINALINKCSSVFVFIYLQTNNNKQQIHCKLANIHLLNKTQAKKRITKIIT